MRAAADLLGEFAHGVNLHALAVPVAKEADGALRAGFVHGHFHAGNGRVRNDGFVYKALYFLELVRRNLAFKAEVKAQALRGCLLYTSRCV